jgi:HK97 family phage major capsid protein
MTTETKQAAPSPETRAALHEVMAVLESYKASNNARLAAIEAKQADVLLEEKTARIDADLSRAQARYDRSLAAPRRPVLDPAPRLAEPDERKAAWNAYLKTGQVLPGLIEAKGLSESVNASGGFLTLPELEAQILRRLSVSSLMRDICQIQVMGAGVYRKPVSTAGIGASWIAETAARPETTAPTLDIIDFPAFDLYAAPAATQSLLDDALINMDDWLAAEIDDAFAAQETSAFINGDGVNKPKGLLGYTIAADANQTWGQLGYLATGVIGGFPPVNPTDKLIDLIYTPRVQYRAGGRFVMNRKTVSAVRKFKDNTGNYIWNAALQPGASATLLGYPVTEIETMPDVAANSHSIAFGDFKRGYLIVDRAGVRVLRDPYSAKPNVLFYTTKRVGGGIQNFDAIKLLKFSAT